mgnify:CR=1 FL=1
MNLEDFIEGIHDYGLDFSQEKATEIFGSFDKDGNGTISFDEFVVGLRGDLSGVRLDIVKEAFKRADRSGDGVFDIKDFMEVYNVTEHPKYKIGEWDEGRIFEAFLQFYQPDKSKRDGMVTQEDFINYYTGISASIDNDDYFVLIVRNAWAN